MNGYSGPAFILMQTRDPAAAAQRYKEITGHAATLILARPEFVVTAEISILVRSSKAAFGALLVTHETNMDG